MGEKMDVEPKHKRRVDKLNSWSGMPQARKVWDVELNPRTPLIIRMLSKGSLFKIKHTSKIIKRYCLLISSKLGDESKCKS